MLRCVTCFVQEHAFKNEYLFYRFVMHEPTYTHSDQLAALGPLDDVLSQQPTDSGHALSSARSRTTAGVERNRSSTRKTRSISTTLARLQHSPSTTPSGVPGSPSSPVIAGLLRQTTEDLKALGYQLPASTQVSSSSRATQRSLRPRLQDASDDDLDPERIAVCLLT